MFVGGGQFPALFAVLSFLFYIGLDEDVYPRQSLPVELVPEYDERFGLVRVVLAILLFLVIVAVATICNFDSGAILSKGSKVGWVDLNSSYGSSTLPPLYVYSS